MLIPLSSCSATSWASIPGQSGSGWSRSPQQGAHMLLDFGPLSSWVAQQSRLHPAVGSTCLEEITLLRSIAFPLAFWCKLMLTCVRDRRGHSRMFRCVRERGPPGPPPPTLFTWSLLSSVPKLCGCPGCPGLA